MWTLVASSLFVEGTPVIVWTLAKYPKQRADLRVESLFVKGTPAPVSSSVGQVYRVPRRRLGKRSRLDLELSPVSACGRGDNFVFYVRHSCISFATWCPSPCLLRVIILGSMCGAAVFLLQPDGRNPRGAGHVYLQKKSRMYFSDIKLIRF
ncbi:hypothetical protein NDU88_003708 [Pleurodeles waltl]|uniref:Uncharacterized protein n=1 Tax=Pleurodeles waltl TaxID=8319 RepID=A0AAV7RDN5_PLEWA|nr:hypothetical protein NDU88_003708 [Pleurodeles waltl]